MSASPANCVFDVKVWHWAKRSSCVTCNLPEHFCSGGGDISSITVNHDSISRALKLLSRAPVRALTCLSSDFLRASLSNYSKPFNCNVFVLSLFYCISVKSLTRLSFSRFSIIRQGFCQRPCSRNLRDVWQHTKVMLACVACRRRKGREEGSSASAKRASLIPPLSTPATQAKVMYVFATSRTFPSHYILASTVTTFT